MAEKPIRKNLSLGRLRIDGDTQPRVRLDDPALKDYEEAIASGVKLPPVVAFYDDSQYWLADGFHRWHAHRNAGRRLIACHVIRGTQEDAQWYAIAANQGHGLPRSTADKVKAVKAALKHPEGVKLSDPQIAEHVGVDQKTVLKYRNEMESTKEIPKSPTRKGKDGRTIDTSNIGKKPKPPEEAGPACSWEVAPTTTCRCSTIWPTPPESTDIRAWVRPDASPWAACRICSAWKGRPCNWIRPVRLRWWPSIKRVKVFARASATWPWPAG